MTLPETSPDAVARGLDGRAHDLRFFLHVGIPAAAVIGLLEGTLGIIYAEQAAVVGAFALFGFLAWVVAYVLPRIGHVPVEGLVLRMAVAMCPAVVLASLVEPGAGTIATLLPVAVGLPYLSDRHRRWLVGLSLGLALVVAVSTDLYLPTETVPAGLRIILHVAGIVTAVGLVSLLVAQFANRLRTTTRELASVIALSTELAQTLDAHEVGDITARSVATATGADECGICFWDRETDRVLTFGYHPADRRSAIGESYDLADYPATRAVLEGQRAMLVSDLDPTADPAEVAYLHSIGQRSMATIPLIAKGRVLGAIEATSHRVDFFDLRRMRLAETIAADAAMALENARLYEEAHHQAFYDDLTGLANRNLFRDRAAQALRRRPNPENELVAVLFLDLDDFKNVNTSLGHVGGDQLLAAVAERLQGCLRSGDTASRLSGDEFAILLEGLTEDSEATRVAQRVIDALRQPFRIGETAAVVGTSIGIALAAPGEASADDVMRDADLAMDRAKQLDKGRYEVFRPSLREVANERAALVALLRGAADRDELRVYYQPIVDLADGTILGVEALVRWQPEGRDLLLPSDFIGLAEESGLIVQVGRWVLERACRETQAWRRRYHLPSLSVSVNLSARQFQHPDLVAEVGAALVDSGLDPSHLVLEITESVLMAHTATAIGKLGDLRGLGVRLAIDDFGTGYSSLGYLERFPVDILKIDKTFIDSIGERGNRPVLARAIVQLGKALELQVVAEGIERPEQAAALRRLGCSRGQGYLYARPLPARELEPLLAEGRIGLPGVIAGASGPIPIQRAARGIA